MVTIRPVVNATGIIDRVNGMDMAARCGNRNTDPDRDRIRDRIRIRVILPEPGTV